jgi:hypothetical protein
MNSSGATLRRLKLRVCSKKTGHVGLVFSGPFTQQVAGGVALLVEVDDQGAQTPGWR